MLINIAFVIKGKRTKPPSVADGGSTVSSNYPRYYLGNLDPFRIFYQFLLSGRNLSIKIDHRKRCQ